jgi:hypothetical protein
VGHNPDDGVVRTALRVGMQRGDLIHMDRETIAFDDHMDAVGDAPFATRRLAAMEHATER